MKIEYSKEADALYIVLKEESVAKSREVEEGIVIDFDEAGHVIGVEVLDVSHRLTHGELSNVHLEHLPVS